MSVTSFLQRSTRLVANPNLRKLAELRIAPRQPVGENVELAAATREMPRQAAAAAARTR